MVPVDRLLFLSAPPGVVTDCWAVLVVTTVSVGAMEVIVVMVLAVVPVPIALETVMVDLLPILVTMMAMPDSVRPITVEVGGGVVNGGGRGLPIPQVSAAKTNAWCWEWFWSEGRGR